MTARWRTLALVLLVVLLLGSCGGLFWAAQRSLVQSFTLPGATGVDVSSRDMLALRVAYHTNRSGEAWREDLFQQLVAQGWHSRDYVFGVTRRFSVTWYTRTFTFGPLVVLESAVVGGDPYDPGLVIVEIHRELHWKSP